MDLSRLIAENIIRKKIVEAKVPGAINSQVNSVSRNIDEEITGWLVKINTEAHEALVAYEDHDNYKECLGILAYLVRDSNYLYNYLEKVMMNYDDSIKEDLTIDDEPEETEQKISSADTSINSNKLPAIFTDPRVNFETGSINLDYGGGKYDNVAEYLLKEYSATNLVYDKYNRTPEHNREVLHQIRKNGGADTVTCSNVLNVIAEKEERLAVLRNCKRYLKDGGTCYITVYEGDNKTKGEGVTKSGYQLRRKTADYEDEIKSVFPSAVRKGKLYICK